MAGPWRLVGRQDELAFGVAAVADGETAGLVLAGAAGVGKSRLANEILDAVGDHGVVVRCAATASARSVPFAAVAELIPDVDVSVDNRLGMFRAVIGGLRARADAAGTPVVVGLDDAHLADEPTAALVHHLASRRLCSLVITVRTNEAVPDAVTALWKEGHCARLDVQPLSRAETAELAAAGLGGPVERSTLDRLWQFSSGNALLLRELIVQSLHDGSMARHLDHWRWSGHVYAGGRLTDVVGAGLGRLTPAQRDAVALLAFGEPLGHAAMVAMTSADAVSALIDRGVVSVIRDGQRQCATLSHPLYGEVVRADMSAPEADAIRRRLAEDLQARGLRRAGDAGRLGRYAIDTGMSVPTAVIERAAWEAYRAADYETAELLARADPDWASHSTGFVLGASIGAHGRFDEAYEVFRSSLPNAPTEEVRARSAYFLIDILAIQWNRFDDAAVVFRETEELLTDNRWRNVLAAAWTPILVLHDRIDEATVMARSMQASDDALTRVASVRGLAYTLVPAGRTAEMLGVCDEMLGPAFSLRNEWAYGLYDVVGGRLMSLLMEGRVDEVDPILALAEGAAEPDREYESLAFLSVVRGRVALLRGQPQTAARHLREAAATFSELAFGIRGSWTLRLLAEAAALTGDATSATALVDEARSADSPLRYPLDSDGTRAEGWAVAATGALSAARDHLLAEVAATRARGQFGYEAMLLHDVVRLGGVDSDVVVVSRLGELRDVVDGPAVGLYAAHAAALAADDGALLDDVSVGFEELGLRLLAAEAAAEAAAAHRVAGLVARAHGSASRSAALRADCEGAVTPALAGAVELVRLTKREREMAALAARGASNREIAEQLHVSPRTVENHLQRVYTKLQVSGRDELPEALGAKIE